MQLSGNLGYNTCLCTISHNNITTSFVGILSGATDYYGIHSLAIHSTGDIVIENGIRGDGNLKIINKMSGSQLISLIPIGIDSLPLTLVRYLIISEMVSSMNYIDSNGIREFRFDGDFNDVIAVTTIDTTSTVAEYVSIAAHRKSIFSGFNLTKYSGTSHRVLIVRCNGFKTISS